MLTPEYYCKRIGKLRFTVTKFDGTTEPVEIYDVSFSSLTDTGRCSCLGFRVHGTGKNDKHIQMIRSWLYGGELPPDGFFYDHRPFRIPKTSRGTVSNLQAVRSKRGRFGTLREANAHAQMVGRDVRNRRSA